MCDNMCQLRSKLSADRLVQRIAKQFSRFTLFLKLVSSNHVNSARSVSSGLKEFCEPYVMIPMWPSGVKNRHVITLFREIQTDPIMCSPNAYSTGNEQTHDESTRMREGALAQSPPGSLIASSPNAGTADPDSFRLDVVPTNFLIICSN